MPRRSVVLSIVLALGCESRLMAQSAATEAEKLATFGMPALPSSVALGRPAANPYGDPNSISPDGKWLVALSTQNIEGMDNKVVLLRTADGQEERAIPIHHGSILAVSFSRDNKYLSTSTTTDGVRIWNVETGKHVRDLPK